MQADCKQHKAFSNLSNCVLSAVGFSCNTLQGAKLASQTAYTYLHDAGAGQPADNNQHHAVSCHSACISDRNHALHSHESSAPAASSSSSSQQGTLHHPPDPMETLLLNIKPCRSQSLPLSPRSACTSPCATSKKSCLGPQGVSHAEDSAAAAVPVSGTSASPDIVIDADPATAATAAAGPANHAETR